MNAKKMMFIAIVLLMPSLMFSAITKGPYLVSPEKSSMTIMWESDSNEASKVIYWQSEEIKNELIANSFDSNNDLFLYRAIISDLQPNLLIRKYFVP